MTSTSPVVQIERIPIIDSLRGFAILGILLMNIAAFAYGPAGYNPLINAETGINFSIWKYQTWIFSGTQRALFGLLFGAGLILFMRDKEQKGNGVMALDRFFRRQLWLMVFGLVNIYIFLWHGDILFDYGCLGFLVLAFRNWPARRLIIAAFACALLMVARENRELYLDKEIIARGEAISAIDTTINNLSPTQKKSMEEYKEFKERSNLSAARERNALSNEEMAGSFGTIYKARTAEYREGLIEYLYLRAWDVLLFIFLGMAFFKMGILTGQLPLKFYVAMALVGLAAGLSFSWFDIKEMIRAGFSPFQYAQNVAFTFDQAGRPLRALGLFATLMLLYKSGLFKWLFYLMQPVGQMAFTNYLTQSLICATLFYGIGFGFYGQLQRFEVYLIVLMIWIVQAAWSHVWLRFFNYGPLEWVWRMLTYGKSLPIRKVPFSF